MFARSLAVLALIILLLMAHSSPAVEIPPPRLVSPTIAGDIVELFVERERIVNSTYVVAFGGSARMPFFDMQKNYYEGILPAYQGQLNRLKQAKKNVAAAQRAVSYWSGAAVGGAGRGMATNNLLAAQGSLANALAVARQCELEVQNNEVFQSVSKQVSDSQGQLHNTYLKLKALLPESSADPNADAILKAYLAGCRGEKPVEAHVLSAMAAAYTEDRVELQQNLAMAAALMSELPYYPTLLADFCVTACLAGENAAYQEHLDLLFKKGRDSTDPHYLWAVGVCRTIADRGSSSIYFRKASASFDDAGQLNGDKDGILADALSFLVKGDSSLPKDLERFSLSDGFRRSGHWRSLFARSFLSTTDDESQAFFAEALARCPPLFKDEINASMRPSREAEVEEAVKPPEPVVDGDAVITELKSLIEKHANKDSPCLFLKRDEKIVGPLSVKEVRSAVEGGYLKSGDMIASSELGPWATWEKAGFKNP